MRILGAATDLPLTLVVAPTGTGKTVTLEHLAQAQPALAVRWVGTGRGIDTDALANIVRTAAGVRPRTSRRLVAQTTLGNSTVESLRKAQAQQLVVIDDAHLMSSGCFGLVDDLLNRCPAALRLVLVCQWDPPLARLVPTLRGIMTVIRGDAFRMTAAEATQLVSAHAGQLPPDAVDAILKSAQGWAAVLVLAARTVAGAPDPRAAAARLLEPGLVVADRLASQAFSALPVDARHLLLCIAAEEAVDEATAERLSGDSSAGTLLAQLESSGLLVSRVPHEATDIGASYRVHPLLSEVLQRRLRAGGTQVVRAREVVLRSVRRDVAHGDVDDALRRLTAVHASRDAIDLIADRGAELLMLGQGHMVQAAVTAAPEAVEEEPRSWPILALERWLAADYRGASHWTDRVLDHAAGEAGDAGRVDVALVRLIEARASRDRLSDAVSHAQGLTEPSEQRSSSSTLTAWLLMELGAAENWLGGLTEAAVRLGRATAIAQMVGLPQLEAAALSHLAVTEYLQGHHEQCRAVAGQALDTAPRWLTRTSPVIERARIALELSRSFDHLNPEDIIGVGELASSSTSSDPTTTVCRLILAARLFMRDGSIEEASAALTVPPATPPLPPHLSAALIGERCVYAALQKDASLLGQLEQELRDIDAIGEATLVRAHRAELDGHPRRASSALRSVIEEKVTGLLPTSRVVAMTFQAQLLDSFGNASAADALMHEALRRTATHRVLSPFCGWSITGTRIRDLVYRTTSETTSGWATELRKFVDHREGFHAFWTPSPAVRPPDSDSEMFPAAHVPRLTRREHEVLEQLGSGSSYADIAETLVVSENTVKTHVSSLYAKLGATRRSEALKIARGLHVI